MEEETSLDLVVPTQCPKIEKALGFIVKITPQWPYKALPLKSFRAGKMMYLHPSIGKEHIFKTLQLFLFSFLLWQTRTTEESRKLCILRI